MWSTFASVTSMPPIGVPRVVRGCKGAKASICGPMSGEQLRRSQALAVGAHRQPRTAFVAAPAPLGPPSSCRRRSSTAARRRRPPNRARERSRAAMRPVRHTPSRKAAHACMIRAERTCRVGSAGIAGEQRTLGSGSRPSRARADRTNGTARASTPFRDSERTAQSRARSRASERSRTFSKRQRRNGGRRRTRQHVPVGRDGDELPSPAVHARLGKITEVVGKHVDDLHLAAQALAGRGDDLLAVANLFAASASTRSRLRYAQP